MDIKNLTAESLIAESLIEKRRNEIQLLLDPNFKPEKKGLRGLLGSHAVAMQVKEMRTVYGHKNKESSSLPNITGEKLKISDHVLDKLGDSLLNDPISYQIALEVTTSEEKPELAFKVTKDFLNDVDKNSAETFESVVNLISTLSEKNSLLEPVVPILQYALLSQYDRTVKLSKFPKEIEKDGFEAVYGSESVTHLQWIKNLLKVAKSVAKVKNIRSGKTIGSGFIVDGSVINKIWAKRKLLLTNGHVVNDYGKDAVTPRHAVAEFTEIDGSPVFDINELLFHSPKEELDISILGIQVPEYIEPLDITPYLPLVPKSGTERERIFVIGHPGGAELAVSMYDNELINYKDDYVRYRSPTEAGNSGSPVMTKSLEVFAIHHRALADLEANQGVLLNSILEKINAI